MIPGCHGREGKGEKGPYSSSAASLPSGPSRYTLMPWVLKWLGPMETSSRPGCHVKSSKAKGYQRVRPRLPSMAWMKAVRALPSAFIDTPGMKAQASLVSADTCLKYQPSKYELRFRAPWKSSGLKRGIQGPFTWLHPGQLRWIQAGSPDQPPV